MKIRIKGKDKDKHNAVMNSIKLIPTVKSGESSFTSDVATIYHEAYAHEDYHLDTSHMALVLNELVKDGSLNSRLINKMEYWDMKESNRLHNYTNKKTKDIVIYYIGDGERTIRDAIWNVFMQIPDGVWVSRTHIIDVAKSLNPLIHFHSFVTNYCRWVSKMGYVNQIKATKENIDNHNVYNVIHVRPYTGRGSVEWLYTPYTGE